MSELRRSLSVQGALSRRRSSGIQRDQSAALHLTSPVRAGAPLRLPTGLLLGICRYPPCRGTITGGLQALCAGAKEGIISLGRCTPPWSIARPPCRCMGLPCGCGSPAWRSGGRPARRLSSSPMPSTSDNSQTSIRMPWQIVGLVEGILSGETTVGEALGRGDFGLGTLNMVGRRVKAAPLCCAVNVPKLRGMRPCCMGRLRRRCQRARHACRQSFWPTVVRSSSACSLISIAPHHWPRLCSLTARWWSWTAWPTSRPPMAPATLSTRPPR